LQNVLRSDVRDWCNATILVRCSHGKTLDMIKDTSHVNMSILDECPADAADGYGMFRNVSQMMPGMWNACLQVPSQ
jgi:hypothetical protein